MRHFSAVILILFLFGACTSAPPPRVLIFSKTSEFGYRHQSIEAGRDALAQLCYQHGIMADTTEDAALISEKNLKKYAAVIFLSTNGEVLGPDQEADFERYIQAGGGFVGIHASSATEYAWKWFGGLIGGYFKDHPPVQESVLHAESKTDPATQNLHGQHWKDEWYNFRNHEPDLEILLSVDATLYKGGTLPDADSSRFSAEHHPVAWRHQYDGGRAFYTALGHLEAAYSDPHFQEHLLGGIQYAIGGNKPLNYNRCHTVRRPDQTRFVKNTVADHLREPMELDQLPDGRILFIERHGYLRLFNPATEILSTVIKLPVYSEMGDGLIGMAVDPEYERTQRIFLYYSSLKDSLNQLSQFVFRDDTLDRSSEKVILTVPVGRHNCFHAAGSIEFGPDGLLYLATGDNTSPFASDGYSPNDTRPGRKAFDAARSSGNTNDLRGKILRIKVEDNGTYTCPPDNLFTQNKQGRPEIYIMGCRNPFRISIDQRRNWLFWGEIGPDAGKDDALRGPRGHDEINRARTAGNYGWPFFVGDNQAYRAYDFAAQTAGPAFDPRHPVNTSPNNTGAQNLPPAQSAFIWYPYARNRDFVMLGEGGRNAMAGPTYYTDRYDENTRYPDYYNGKTIIYDWMRNWLMMVSTDTSGNLHYIEPFGDSLQLSRPMDMIIDHKTGAIWLLEYGQKWYSSNNEASLSRIDFQRGNRPPVARLEADRTAGACPLPVRFALNKSGDNDHNPLHYQLDCKDIFQFKTQRPDTLSYTFTTTGTYQVVLTVTDPSGSSHTDTLEIQAGNAAPEVSFALQGTNRSFYRPGDTLFYQIAVNDREDGRLRSGIAPEQIHTEFDFFDKCINPNNLPKKAAGEDEQYVRGKALVAGSDCSSCHATDHQVNGPAFQAVAERYRNNRDFAVATIYRKIIYGGSGNWGQRAMSAHPDIREEDAIEMARWILALGDPVKPVQALALEGAYPLSAKGTYVFKAAYTDRGSFHLPALTNESLLVLRPYIFEVENCDSRKKGVSNLRPFGNDTTVLQELKHNSWFAIHRADLKGIQSLTLRLGSGDAKHTFCGGTAEVHADNANGPLLGQVTIPANNPKRMIFTETEIPLQADHTDEFRDLFFVFKNKQEQNQSITAVDWVRFNW